MTITDTLCISDVDPGAGLDIEGLRKKYTDEREKRTHPQRSAQFTEVNGEFSRYIDDPYVEQPLVREPVERTVEAIVVGGGFGGLITAANLLKIGIEDFLIVEKAGDFGGTWYWNRYPGAQCDIESYIYMPLLEETGYVPTEKYAHADELFGQAKRIGQHFGLYERALFQTQATRMKWEERAGRWHVTTDRGDSILARYIFSASGPLNRPKLPGIRGINRFVGKTFHTSRWDYGYTRGNSRGGMTGLVDKRVAVIGTGATAIQCVPYVARDAAHLFVVQRTPSTVDVRGNRPTNYEWVRSLVPGWQRERMDNFNVLISGLWAERDLVQDGWTELFRDMVLSWLPRDGSSLPPQEMARLSEIADFRKGEKLRKRVDELVSDPATAEALKPWYQVFCKRPTFNDDYLPAFNRPNVTLVDTQGRGLDEITETGIVFDGVEHEVDCIVFATGFEVGTAYTRRAAFEVIGTGERKLSEHYAQGNRSLHGFFVHGFPNFFMLAQGQSGFKPNVTDMLAEQAEHIIGVIAAARAKGLTRIEATAEAEEEWVQTIYESSLAKRAFLESCTPGYYSGEGDVSKGLIADHYGHGSVAFTALLEAWRATGTFRGLTIR
ncbi:NAD(P)/FAD-dependent oxidoreductase [Burkholderia sp. Bp9142]|uniref:flavin-containing monooxygenase n=1 Tax=Burkholderia sp. Bp9142 TaxID=2184573 RepID=UPI000F5B4184|nr:NAD(P)/FAD-dependent oxidoreductase [Burkholderia sp. Bp9142]RQR33321.1 NAD(P)/FAD-dependent oxidoreductase [Burkholderia sp. Bp9142]